MPETKLQKSEQENIDIIALHPFNQLMMTSAITEPSSLPQPYTILRGKQICMSDFYKDNRKFVITTK